jgi:hypothetical protein
LSSALLICPPPAPPPTNNIRNNRLIFMKQSMNIVMLEAERLQQSVISCLDDINTAVLRTSEMDQTLGLSVQMSDI